MEIYQLRALEAIVLKGSFLLAAETLDVSQSSLSHAIAVLEKELGVRLLDRDRLGARPTETGRRILAHARQILSSLDAIRSETILSSGPLVGRVRVGSIPSAAIAFLPKVIARFKRANPNVELVLLEEPSQSTQLLEDWLNTRMIDVALLQLPTHNVATTPLLCDELCAILPAKTPLSARRRVSIRDLADQPLILSRYTSESLLYAAYQRLRLTPLIRYQVQDLGTLINMVREGLGFSIVPRIAFPTALPGVTLISVTPRIRRDLGLAICKRLPVPSPVQAFICTLEEVAAKRRRN